MRLQGFDHLLHCAMPESLLLSSAPGIGLAAPTTGRSGTQIVADVEKVAQKDSLPSKHFPALKLDPLSPISSGVDLTVQCPAGRSCAVPPAPSGVCHAAEGGPLERRGTVLCLGCHQSHLLPLSGTFALPRSWRYRADHGSVSLGDHMLCTHCRQHSKGLLILLPQFFTR